MAQSSGFFNAQYQDGEYDRVYNAEQFAAYFASFIGNGIFGDTMDELLPMAANPNNMSIDILSGKAWINGWWYENDETYNIPIALADGVLNRKDIVVVRWGNSERDIWLQVIQGEPAIEAVAPTIRRDADYFDLELCEINVPAGTTKITQAQITDTRLDNSVCGLVTGLVHQIDTTALYLQFNQQFNDWFEAVKEQFEGDVPEILQAQIDDLFGIISSRIETTSTSTHAYSNKDYFIYDNKLCKATKSIAVGDTISPGTGVNDNCIYTTIMQEIKTGGVTVVEELADIIAMTEFDGEAAGAKAVKNLNLGLESLNTALGKKLTVDTWWPAGNTTKPSNTYDGVYSTNPSNIPSDLLSYINTYETRTGVVCYGTIYTVKSAEYFTAMYIDVYGNVLVRFTNTGYSDGRLWNRLTNQKILPMFSLIGKKCEVTQVLSGYYSHYIPFSGISEGDIVLWKYNDGSIFIGFIVKDSNNKLYIASYTCLLPLGVEKRSGTPVPNDAIGFVSMAQLTNGIRVMESRSVDAVAWYCVLGKTLVSDNYLETQISQINSDLAGKLSGTLVTLAMNHTITTTEKEISFGQDIDNFKLLNFSLVILDMPSPAGTASIVSPAVFKNTTRSSPLLINFDIDTGHYIAAYYVNDTKIKIYSTGQNIATHVRFALFGMN